MKRFGLSLILALLALAVYTPRDSFACRFNVRETGFVDLGIESYRFYLLVDSTVPQTEIRHFSEAAEDSFRNNLISFALVRVEENPGHPAVEPWRELGEKTLPFGLVAAPGGQFLSMGTLWRKGGTMESAQRSLQEIATSPVRERIAADLAKAFGVILLIEGSNQSGNASTLEVIDQAIETVEAELEYFPKPINQGPVLVSLSPEEFLSDPILPWCFHLEGKIGPDPTVVVLYGRGRWIGPAMIGPEITYDLLTRLLFIVGADCECGLDPRLIRGTGIPLRWGRVLRETVAQDLGFDPENPLVRIEVSQIMKVNTWLDARADLEGDLGDAYTVPNSARSRNSLPKGRVPRMIVFSIGSAVGVVLLAGIVLLAWRSRSRL